MIRTSATQFKAKLGRYMRAVREGNEVVVTDRDQPVARLVPIQRPASAADQVPLATPREPTAPPLGTLRVKSIVYTGPSTLEVLRADRERR